MSDEERRLGPPFDLDKFKAAKKARIAKKAAAYDELKKKRGPEARLSRGYTQWLR